MEKRLARLFDYQKFSPNPRLAAMLADARVRYAKNALSDEALELVSAAGEAGLPLYGSDGAGPFDRGGTPL